jgi:hypothetical protein
MATGKLEKLHLVSRVVGNFFISRCGEDEQLNRHFQGTEIARVVERSTPPLESEHHHHGQLRSLAIADGSGMSVT